MKAISYSQYGGPEVLKLADLAKPVPLKDEVLIKVYAASVNDWDWGLLQGDFVNRLMYGWLRPKKTVLGSDMAGRIEAVGKNVTLFKVGDEVYGDLSGRWGGFAEYVCANEKSLALKPSGMSFEQAAAIPQAAMLAVQALIDQGNIQPGQKLLINGAGGGVGTFALQIAKLHGLEVTGVDRTSKLDFLRSLGFDHVIDYTREDFTRTGRLYDLILDVKTNRPIINYTRALAPGGKYVTVGGSMGWLLQAVTLGPLIFWLTKKHIRLVMLKTNKDLEYMNDLSVGGKMIPAIDGSYRLEELPEAMRVFGKGEHKGKIVITVCG